MKLYVISDLHLEFAPFVPPNVDCDVVVLAGDVSTRLSGVRWAMDNFPKTPVLYVFGNHEFYGDKWPRLMEKAKALAAGTNVQVLENDALSIGDFRFFGATLWSDFAATGDVSMSSESARLDMTDFKRVRHWPSLKKFSPTHARLAHCEALRSIRSFLQSGSAKNSVIITHHAPLLECLAPEDVKDPVCGAYASDLHTVIQEYQPQLWIHGHIHRHIDIQRGATRIFANPRGYPGQQTCFSPECVVELAFATQN